MAIYEAEAARWLSRRPKVFVEQAAAFAARVEPGRLRADLGCGPGKYLPHLGAPVLAFDAAMAMLRLAPADALRVQGDLEVLPIRRRSLAGAWSRMAYQHLRRDRMPMALAELHWALDVGAPFELTLSAGDLEGAYPNDDFPGRWFTGYQEEQLADLLVGAGFHVEGIELDGARAIARAVRARSLPDTVGAGMRMLVCGLNPSLYAADAGIGYARPGNRFWPAMVAAGLVDRPLDPVRALRVSGIGMTDLVRRATTASSELSTEEYRLGAQRVERLVRWLQPGGTCFVGLEGWRAGLDRKAVAGPQPEPFGGRPVYVMPSTSGLNAHARLDDFVDHLRRAAAVFG